MSKVIFDASVLLALIKNEPGSKNLEKHLGSIIMSSVNVSEVAATLLDSSITYEEMLECIEPLVNHIVSFDEEQSYLAANLKKLTKHKGLSLGDRACIALGIKLQVPIYTADKIWGNLQLDNANIKLIR